MTGVAATSEGALNLKQVAARLGVHYMTAYRYVRTGRIEGAKVGTEWVVPASAVDAFLAAPPPTGAVPAGAAERATVDWSERLARALVMGDEPMAWQVVTRALSAGHPPADVYDLLGDALRRISLADPEGTAADGYVATATATRVGARLGARFRKPGRSRGTVVFGAPTGEGHSLPIAIVADLVRLEGFTCIELGADVPPFVFAQAAAGASRLVAVGIGATAAANLEALRATIAAVRAVAPDVAVIIGGQAVRNDEVASLAGATHWAADGRQAARIVADLAS